MEYAVRAETKEGDLVTLKRGFPSLSDAEDYPVRLYLWRRVWVEPAAELGRSEGRCARRDG